jgi:hypothetical protein
VEPAQVDTTHSIDGVPIRLTEERWFHIVENHDEVAGYYDEVLNTVSDPEVVLPGHSGSLVAVRNYGQHRYLCVIYRQLSPSDGFIITAYFSREIDRKKAKWSRS